MKKTKKIVQNLETIDQPQDVPRAVNKLDHQGSFLGFFVYLQNFYFDKKVYPNFFVAILFFYKKYSTKMFKKFLFSLKKIKILTTTK